MPSGLDEAVTRVGDRWTLLVVDALRGGPQRFGQLLEGIDGLASNVLTARLRQLELDGLVVRRPYSERPVRVAYALTAPGQELAGALRLLRQWGAARAGRAGTADDLPRHRTCGTPVEPRWWCPTCDVQ